MENNNLTKERIEILKKNGSDVICNLIEEHQNNVGDIMFILENLGYLPKSFNPEIFYILLKHKNEKVRALAVKNIAKNSSISDIAVLHKIIKEDSSSVVVREAVSALGRMRSFECIPLLIETLSRADPKIICQAIRGLLVFKGDFLVDKELKKMRNHENEMVRSIITKEYFLENKSSKSELLHPESYRFMRNVVINSDVRDVLKITPDDSIHLTFTSPPYYNARDYSIYPSYEAYLNFLNEVFLETYRITKEGRFLIVNTSPVIVPRISRAHSSKRYPIPFDLHHLLVTMGWEFIDDIVWEKPEYSVKNRIGGFQQHRKPLAYKPNTVTEYLMVYRKKTDKLIDWNIKQYSIETVNSSKVEDGFETTNIWQICPKSDKIHSAIFPEELCRRVIKYYSFKEDIVFDPFAGSGTLGRTAKSLGRYFFLTEKEKEYFEYMQTFKKSTSENDEYSTKFLSLEQFKKNIL